MRTRDVIIKAPCSFSWIRPLSNAKTESMGSSPSKSAKGKAKKSSLSRSRHSSGSLSSCSLHLDAVIESGSMTSTFDKEESNQDRPVTVPSIQPDDPRNVSSQSQQNLIEVLAQPNSPDTATLTNWTDCARDRKLKLGHVLPPISSETSSVSNRTICPELQKPFGFTTLGNTDILSMKQRNEMVWPIDLERKNIKNITEQTKIIDDLNREGLIGRGRSPLISVAKDRGGGCEYTLSFDPPKRQLPRLIPINSLKKSDEVDKKPPWEREVLPSEHHHLKRRDMTKKTNSSSEKLKIKMLNLDLM